MVPSNPDREAQEQFVAYYQAFMDNKPANEKVLFVDAVHPEHHTIAAYDWIKRGQKRLLKKLWTSTA